MPKSSHICLQCFAALALVFCFSVALAQSNQKPFHVIAFYTAQNDQAHISFVHEANKWFPEMAKKYNFVYDSTKDWTNMNAKFLAKYQAVISADVKADTRKIDSAAGFESGAAAIRGFADRRRELILNYPQK